MTPSLRLVPLLLLLGCGSKDTSPEGTASAATEAPKPAPKPVTLPAGFAEKIDDAVLAKAGPWARATPAKVPGRKGLHVPGGGKAMFASGQRTIATFNYDLSLEQTLAGVMVLLADDGYRVSNFTRASAEQVSFDAVPAAGLGALVVVSSPAGKTATSAGIGIVFGQPDETIADAPKSEAPVKSLVGSRVRAHWEDNGQYSSGKISKVYGKYGKVAFNDGDIGWDLLEAMEPSLPPAADPTSDTCAFKEGDKIVGKWSRDTMKGTIDKVYFGIAHIKFVGGNVGWNECAALKSRA